MLSGDRYLKKPSFFFLKISNEFRSGIQRGGDIDAGDACRKCVGDNFKILVTVSRFQHPRSYYISVGNQHFKMSPTSKYGHQHPPFVDHESSPTSSHQHHWQWFIVITVKNKVFVDILRYEELKLFWSLIFPDMGLDDRSKNSSTLVCPWISGSHILINTSK